LGGGEKEEGEKGKIVTVITPLFLLQDQVKKWVRGGGGGKRKKRGLRSYPIFLLGEESHSIRGGEGEYDTLPPLFLLGGGRGGGRRKKKPFLLSLRE